MKIDEIELKNFRGFKKLQIKLDPKLNVFIGANGSGKTTLLDAISMQLNHLMGKITSFGDNSFRIGHAISDDDINSNAAEVINIIGFKFKNDLIGKYQLSKKLFSKSSQYIGDTKFEEYVKELRSNLNELTSLPVFIYYNSRKNFTLDINVNKHSGTSTNSRIPQFQAYTGSSNKSEFSYKHFSVWWRLEEDRENEIRLRHDKSYKNPVLEVVRSAIRKFMSELHGTIYDNIAVYRTNPDLSGKQNFRIQPEGDLFIEKAGRYLKLSQLSDGEKLLILTAGDIARRLAIANPSNLKKVLATGEGIALLDEVEMHLHPEWQRQVMGAFSKTFENIQFIVTTHSPQVLSKVRAEKVFHFVDFDAKSIEETYGRDANEILNLVFDVPESPFLDDFKEIYRLISKKSIQEAKSKWKSLMNRVGDDHSEVKRLNQILERLKT